MLKNSGVVQQSADEMAVCHENHQQIADQLSTLSVQVDTKAAFPLPE